MSEDRPLGPWLRLYADVIHRKGHYTDRQFRVLIEVYVLALTTHGTLPPKRALAARFGAKEVAFLFSEGDLVEEGDDTRVHRWVDYQTKDRTGAERQARWRERHLSTTYPQGRDVTVTSRVTSSDSAIEKNVTKTNGEVRPLASDDALDAYWQLTGRYPTNKVKLWVEELVERYGDRAVSRQLGVAFGQGSDVSTLLSRTQDLLARDATKAEQAERRRAEEERRAARHRARSEPERVGDADFDKLIAGSQG